MSLWTVLWIYLALIFSGPAAGLITRRWNHYRN
jgi:hypothetical protein